MKIRNKAKHISVILVFTFIFLLSGCNGGEVEELLPQITGTDNVEVRVGTEIPDLLEYIDVTGTNLDLINVDYSSVDINQVGEYIVEFSLNSDLETPIFAMVVKVVDYPVDQMPVIYGAHDIAYVIGDSLPKYKVGLSAVDREYGDLTSLITVDDSLVDYEVPGSYQVTYYVNNIDGYYYATKIDVNVVIDDRDIALTNEFFIIYEMGNYGIVSTEGDVLIPSVYDRIEYAGSNMLKLNNNGNEYFYDITKQEYVQYDYEVTGDFYDGLATVKQGETFYSYMNTSGEVVFPFIYTNVGDFNHGQAIVEMYGNVGVINTSGEQIIPILYENVQSFFGDSYVKYIDGTYELVDFSNHSIVDLIYNNFYPFVNDDGDYFYRVSTVDGQAILDENLNILLETYYGNISQIDNNTYMIDNQSSFEIRSVSNSTVISGITAYDIYDDAIIYQSSNGFGLYNLETETVVVSDDKLSIIPFEDQAGYYLVKNSSGLLGLLKSDGTEVIDYSAMYIYSQNSLSSADDFGYLIVRFDNSHASLYTMDGVAVTTKMYSTIRSFYNGFAQVADPITGLFGYINSNGVETSPLAYYELNNINNGFTGVNIYNNHYGWKAVTYQGVALNDNTYYNIRTFYGTPGNMIAVVQSDVANSQTPVYKYLREDGTELPGVFYGANDFKNGYAVVQFGSDYTSKGVIDMDGNIVISPDGFNSISIFDGYFSVQRESGSDHYDGFYNTNGEVIVSTDLHLHIIGYYKDNRVVMQHDYGQYVIFDQLGNTVLQYQDNFISRYSNGLASFQDSETGLWGYYDLNGQIAIPAIYEEVRDFSTYYAPVKLPGHNLWRFIDKSGNTVMGEMYDIPNYAVTDFYIEIEQYGSYSDAGLLDRNLNVVFDTDYTIYSYSEGYMIYDYTGDIATEYQVISNQGTLTYDFNVNGHDYTFRYIDGWSLLDRDNMLIEGGYDSIKFVESYNAWLVQKGELYGLYDTEFNLIFDSAYNNINYNGYFEYKYYSVVLNGNWGIVSLEGDVVVPAVYDSVEYDYDNELFIVRNGYSFGVYDLNGEMIVDCQYGDIEFVQLDIQTEVE